MLHPAHIIDHYRLWIQGGWCLVADGKRLDGAALAELPDHSALPEAAAVHVIDSDSLTRTATLRLLQTSGFVPHGHASIASFLGVMAGKNRPPVDCVVTESNLSGVDCLELIRHLRSYRLVHPVILITRSRPVLAAVRAIKAGETDVIEKPLRPQALVGALRTALGRRASATADAIPDMRDVRDVSPAEAAMRVAKLSAREHEVLSLLASGEPNKQIARELGISPRTVEVYRSRLLMRLQVRSLEDAINLATLASIAGQRNRSGPA